MAQAKSFGTYTVAPYLASNPFESKHGKVGSALVWCGLGFAFLAGIVFRPDTVTDNRIGIGFVDVANLYSSSSNWDGLEFYHLFYTAIEHVLPLDNMTMAQWDLILGVAGFGIVVFLASWLTKVKEVDTIHAIVFLAMVALSSMYVYMINKDFIQSLFFLVAFALIASDMKTRGKVVALIALFTFEFVIWRKYYLIVALFLPVVLLVLEDTAKPRWKMIKPWKKTIVIAVASFAILLVFAYLLHAVSPSNYASIVLQHGEDRELVTLQAASGIKSVFEISPSSPVYMFVLNWATNVLRLLFPVELFTKGFYYWAFAIFQLYVSVSIIKSLAKYEDLSSSERIAIALYIAFVFASATFEPDFGSWVRHEIAAMPLLIILVNPDLKKPAMLDRKSKMPKGSLAL